MTSIYIPYRWVVLVRLTLEEMEMEVEKIESLVLEMMDMDVEPEVVEMEADSANDREMVGMEL